MTLDDPFADFTTSHVRLGVADICIVLVYLFGLAVVTVYVNRKVGTADSEHYFLGGREIPVWAIGLSLFASNLGTDHLVGLAGSGAASGLAVGLIEWSAAYALLVLGWLFVPNYLAMDIFTVPEYLEKRFNRSFRTAFTWLTIVCTVFTKISVTIFAGAVVLEEIMGWNMWLSSVLLLALTAVYTSIGGLAAVVYTEVLQSIVLIVGSVALVWFGMVAVGGWQGLEEKVPRSHLHLVKPGDHPEYPFPGGLIGMAISGIWYWCTDQVMVQRVLAAKSVSAAQGGCVFAGWLKILPMFIMVLPGVIAAALFPEKIEKDSNRAFALLVTRLLPPGWQGVMVAVMLSSFMAALSSCFNSCSTLFTMDIYKHWHPDVTETTLVGVGRIFTFVLAGVSLLWLPMITYSSEQLFIYIQAMQMIWCTPLSVTFLAACIFPEFSSFNAALTTSVGMILGFMYWSMRTSVPPAYAWEALATLNLYHFACIVFVLLAAVLLVVHKLESRQAEGERKPLLENKYSAQFEAQEWAGMPTKTAAVGLMVALAGMIAFFA